MQSQHFVFPSPLTHQHRLFMQDHNEGRAARPSDTHLLSFPFCSAAYRSVVLSQTYVFLLAMLPPAYTLFFKGGRKGGVTILTAGVDSQK